MVAAARFHDYSLRQLASDVVPSGTAGSHRDSTGRIPDLADSSGAKYGEGNGDTGSSPP